MLVWLGAGVACGVQGGVGRPHDPAGYAKWEEAQTARLFRSFNQPIVYLGRRRWDD